MQLNVEQDISQYIAFWLNIVYITFFPLKVYQAVQVALGCQVCQVVVLTLGTFW